LQVDVPQRLTLTGTRYLLDGRTTVIFATDERGGKRSVELVRRVCALGYSSGIPGRLHLDGEPVAVRSDAESRLVALLRAADVWYTPPGGEADGERSRLSPNALVLGDDIKRVLSRGPEENIRAVRDQVVDWVESPRYVSFAAEAEQARKQAEEEVRQFGRQPWEPRSGFLVVRTFEEVYRTFRERPPGEPVSYSIPRPGVPPQAMAKKYRGIDRLPVGAHPVRVHGVEDCPRAAEEPEAYQLMWDLEDAGRAAEDFVFALQDARRLHAALQAPAKWEIIWVRDAVAGADRSGVGPTLGFEPTWFWGDHFSAVCDCMCFPRWHGTDKEGTLFAEYHERLNESALFRTAEEAAKFLSFYRSHDWTETGDYVIAEVCLPQGRAAPVAAAGVGRHDGSS
jgi:hypothetical protein